MILLCSLHLRIKELVRGDGNSHSKVYGDPTKLDSINLNDLHPRSWLVIQTDSYLPIVYLIMLHVINPVIFLAKMILITI